MNSLQVGAFTVCTPTHRRAIKEIGKVVNRDRGNR